MTFRLFCVYNIIILSVVLKKKKKNYRNFRIQNIRDFYEPNRYMLHYHTGTYTVVPNEYTYVLFTIDT